MKDTLQSKWRRFPWWGWLLLIFIWAVVANLYSSSSKNSKSIEEQVGERLREQIREQRSRTTSESVVEDVVRRVVELPPITATGIPFLVFSDCGTPEFIERTVLKGRPASFRLSQARYTEDEAWNFLGSEGWIVQRENWIHGYTGYMCRKGDNNSLFFVPGVGWFGFEYEIVE